MPSPTAISAAASTTPTASSPAGPSVANQAPIAAIAATATVRSRSTGGCSRGIRRRAALASVAVVSPPRGDRLSAAEDERRAEPGQEDDQKQRATPAERVAADAERVQEPRRDREREKTGHERSDDAQDARRPRVVVAGHAIAMTT